MTKSTVIKTDTLGWMQKELAETKMKLEKARAALERIAAEKYEANPWTVVPTGGAKIAADAIKEI